MGDVQNSEMAIQIQDIHVDKWFQQYSNSDPELNPDPDTVTAAMADSAFKVIIEKWWFAPYDLAHSREVFYNKLHFYCIVIWQLWVKVYLLIALNETKPSQIHTHRGEIFIMYYYSCGENKLGWADAEIVSGLEILPEDAVYIRIQSLLLQSTYSLDLWFCSWRTQAQAILRYFALLLTCFALLMFVCMQLGCLCWFSKVI